MGDMAERITGLLDSAYEYEKASLTSLTEEERQAKGTADDWSPKDVLAHVAHWAAEAARELVDPESWVRPDYGDDFNATNARFWEKYREAGWDEIEALVEKAHEGLVSGVNGLSDEQLTDAERYEWTRGQPLWRRICLGNFYHPMAHLGELFVNRGQIEEANAVQEKAAAMQLELSESDQWRGAVLYNLGCYYALTGQKEKALKNVAEALPLYDDLIEWAPQDGDLASLHDDPNFLTLVES
ncbi:MAG: ClbS/DfsB family four-helix bundle protein [Chloroflexota bacterium]|nr:MAG: ClbS/DfsB family four-helix bundle protein [Chloroflexota bacterium]